MYRLLALVREPLGAGQVANLSYPALPTQTSGRYSLRFCVEEAGAPGVQCSDTATTVQAIYQVLPGEAAAIIRGSLTRPSGPGCERTISLARRRRNHDVPVADLHTGDDAGQRSLVRDLDSCCPGRCHRHHSASSRAASWFPASAISGASPRTTSMAVSSRAASSRHSCSGHESGTDETEASSRRWL